MHTVASGASWDHKRRTDEPPRPAAGLQVLVCLFGDRVQLGDDAGPSMERDVVLLEELVGTLETM